MGWDNSRGVDSVSTTHYSSAGTVTPGQSPLDEQVSGSHYREMAIQPVEYITQNRLGFLEGAIIKYVSRHRAKNGAEDIEKAIHCARLLLELTYADQEIERIEKYG